MRRKNLFVYGSLMYHQVWSRLLKGRHARQPAQLLDHKRVCIHGEYYPALIADSGSSVQGMLVSDLTVRDIKVLDEFEGRYYQRISVTVSTATAHGVACDVYLFRNKYRHLLSDREWSNETFRSKYLSKFIKTYR